MNETPNAEKDKEQQNKRLIPEEIMAQTRQFLKEMEADIIITTTLFNQGHIRCEKFGEMTLDKPYDVAQLLTSLYSTTTQMWGKIRGTNDRVESLRKYWDLSKYTLVKKQFAEQGQSKYTQKDVDSLVAVNNKYILVEAIEWSELYSRVCACKDTLEQQLKSIELIWKMKQSEMRIGQY